MNINHNIWNKILDNVILNKWKMRMKNVCQEYHEFFKHVDNEWSSIAAGYRYIVCRMFSFDKGDTCIIHTSSNKMQELSCNPTGYHFYMKKCSIVNCKNYYMLLKKVEGWDVGYLYTPYSDSDN